MASYFRIALQIGWDYNSVRTYQNRPLDFINLVSGRGRMSLANLVFKTFNIPTKEVNYKAVSHKTKINDKIEAYASIFWF